MGGRWQSGRCQSGEEGFIDGEVQVLLGGKSGHGQERWVSQPERLVLVFLF